MGIHPVKNHLLLVLKPYKLCLKQCEQTYTNFRTLNIKVYFLFRKSYAIKHGLLRKSEKITNNGRRMALKWLFNSILRVMHL